MSKKATVPTYKPVYQGEVGFKLIYCIVIYLLMQEPIINDFFVNTAHLAYFAIKSLNFSPLFM